MPVSSTGFKLTLETIQSKAQYDRQAKSILSFKVLLAWILKSCAEEFKDYTISFIENQCIESDLLIGQEAVHQNQTEYNEGERLKTDANLQIDGRDTESSMTDEGRNTFDIRFTAIVLGTDKTVELFINIEFQKRSFDLGYPLPKRGLYYCARMISKQYGTVFVHSEYGKLRKVYSIWICPNTDIQEADSIISYRIAPKVCHGTVNPEKEEYDILDTTIISLTKDFMSSNNAVIRLLGTIFMPQITLAEKEKILEDEFQIPMTEEWEETLGDMSNWSDGIFEMGEKEGEIIGTVKTYRKMGVNPKEITELIMSDFSLDKEAAEKYVAETLGLQTV